MQDIRLVGLAKPSNGGNQGSISRLTGFELRRDGDDWLIPGNDPVLTRGPTDILVTREAWELEPRNYQAIGEEYERDFLLPYFEEKLTQPDNRVPIYGDWGVRTPLEQHLLNFFLTPTGTIPARLQQEIFPFFASDPLNASLVAPLTAKADLQAAFLSIAKILALIEYTGVEDTGRHIAEQKQLNAALPSALDMLSYVESLNTMCPAAISLPVHRIGSSLHFMRGRTWFFPRLAIENIYEQVLTNIDPISDKTVAFFTQDQHIQKRAIATYFATSVESVNRLTRYLNDLRTFVDDQGRYQPMNMVKAHSVVRLMFADWQVINFTNSRYMRLRMALAFLDKFANLVAMMSGRATEEDLLFRRICSQRTGNLLAETLRDNFGRRYHSLGRLMEGITRATYSSIHNHISTQLRKSTSTEEERLIYLRTLRNSAHGAFLRSNQFEQVFLAAGGTICMEFTFLPLLLLWGLASDPKGFLQKIG